MLRITQQDNASGAKRYYGTADYYSEGQELVGRWGGKGAARLGLAGTVDKASFERLCDNLDPKTGEPLTVRTRSERTVGYDFTFSVPKSVSILYGLSGDQGILDAFRGAVDDTIQEIETEMKTRVRKGGLDQDRVTGNMVWAEFIHTTARPIDGIPDPQLHAHVFAFNSTYDQEEERWKAGQFRELKRDAPYFQAAFRVRLANNLQDLGFGVQRKRDDFEIAGMPADVLKRFSRRTTLIEKIAGEKGITDPARKAELGAQTRESKNAHLSWKELRKEWRNRLSGGEWNTVSEVYRRERAAARPERGEVLAVNHAIEHSYVREAVVPERKLVTEGLKRGIGSVTVEGVTREVGKRPLIRNVIDGRAMATTKEMLALESKLVEFARHGRGRCRPLGDPDRPFSRDWLNQGQRRAISHALGSRDRVMIIRGVAGTGKTTLEQELGEALAEAGKPVVALAQSVKASREVLREEAGFASADTVARFLKDEKMQESVRHGVVLVDEAGMLGARDMMSVFEQAERLSARVILVGDKRQHRSVSAGEPLKLLEETAGLKVAEVREILRQSGDYKKAAKALSEGHTEQAFSQLDRLGWIKEIQGDRYGQVADAYVTAAAEKTKDGKRKTALVVSPTHAEADRVTAAIRDRLKEQGKLTKERIVSAWSSAHLTEAQKADAAEYDAGYLVQFHQNTPGGHTKGSRMVVAEGTTPPVEYASRFEVYRPVQLPLAVGDRIRVTAGGKTKDGRHRLNNGSLFTIQGFSKAGDIVVDHGWVIDRDFGHIAHGYTQTSHASQGVTVHHVLVAVSGESLAATNERTAYVALTRGKERATVFTDDKEELFAAMRRPDAPLSATELSQSAKERSTGEIRQLAAIRQPVADARQQEFIQKWNGASRSPGREVDHDR